MFAVRRIIVLLLTPAIFTVYAATEPEAKTSPWLITPTLSSDPKLGTSIGLMAGYLHHFDKQSPVSLFGIMSSYSSTDSIIGGIFTKSYFDNGQQRLLAFIGGGRIKNSYDDFLGSGLPLSSTDALGVFAGRYLHNIEGDWYAGVQAAKTNYTITGNDFISNEILQRIGLTGFDSVGIGLAVHYDSRDNQNSPLSGHSLELNNLAYREALGGSSSFDTYKGDLKSFFKHGQQHVFATKLSARWTHNAPASAYSSVDLRGYTIGQYLAPYMTSIEMEERYAVYENWGAVAFAGIACLYGNSASCSDSNQLYPMAGAGLRYLLKPENKMVVSVDLAKGKSDNNGFYMRFGQAF